MPVIEHIIKRMDKRQFYIQPAAEVLELHLEGVIAESNEDFGMGPGYDDDDFS